MPTFNLKDVELWLKWMFVPCAILAFICWHGEMRTKAMTFEGAAMVGIAFLGVFCIRRIFGYTS